MTAQQRVEACIARIYEVFTEYSRPKNLDFCTFCYDASQLEHLRTTPLKDLEAEITRLLIWEVSDHFGGTEVYKHFLPRILEYLAPPFRCEDMYPEHLFETLKAHNFDQWPAVEREAFWSYVLSVAEALEEVDRRAAREWRTASRRLAGSPFLSDESDAIDRDPFDRIENTDQEAPPEEGLPDREAIETQITEHNAPADFFHQLAGLPKPQIIQTLLVAAEVELYEGSFTAEALSSAEAAMAAARAWLKNPSADQEQDARLAGAQAQNLVAGAAATACSRIRELAAKTCVDALIRLKPDLQQMVLDRIRKRVEGY